MLSPNSITTNNSDSGLLNPRIAAKSLTVGYEGTTILNDLSVTLPAGKTTCLIGPNGCGKSTLLKALSGLLESEGQLLLDGQDLRTMPRSDRARQLALLPQHPTAPDALSVSELVARGRHPHQSWIRRWSSDDEHQVIRALEVTGMLELANRPLHALSGGQRQRAWIAMTLAQDTPTVLLDEPTTFLDLVHSIEVLRLVRTLVQEEGKTVVMVLHDLNLAARFATHLVAMNRSGRITAEGAPRDIITPELLEEVFGLQARVITDPVTGGPLIVPEE